MVTTPIRWNVQPGMESHVNLAKTHLIPRVEANRIMYNQDLRREVFVLNGAVYEIRMMGVMGYCSIMGVPQQGKRGVKKFSTPMWLMTVFNSEETFDPTEVPSLVLEIDTSLDVSKGALYRGHDSVTVQPDGPAEVEFDEPLAHHSGKTYLYVDPETEEEFWIYEDEDAPGAELEALYPSSATSLVQGAWVYKATSPGGVGASTWDLYVRTSVSTITYDNTMSVKLPDTIDPETGETTETGATIARIPAGGSTVGTQIEALAVWGLDEDNPDYLYGSEEWREQDTVIAGIKNKRISYIQSTYLPAGSGGEIGRIPGTNVAGAWTYPTFYCGVSSDDAKQWMFFSRMSTTMQGAVSVGALNFTTRAPNHDVPPTGDPDEGLVEWLETVYIPWWEEQFEDLYALAGSYNRATTSSSVGDQKMYLDSGVPFDPEATPGLPTNAIVLDANINLNYCDQMTIYPEGYVASFLYSETWPDSVQRAYLLVEPDNKGTVQTKTFERQIVEDYHWSRYNNNALVLPDKAPIMGDGLIKHGNLVWARTTNEEV